MPSCYILTFYIIKIYFTSKNSHEVHRLFLPPRHQTKNYLNVPEQDGHYHSLHQTYKSSVNFPECKGKRRGRTGARLDVVRPLLERFLPTIGCPQVPLAYSE